MTDLGKLNLFDKFNDAYTKFPNLSERLAVDEIIVCSSKGKLF
jgi:hypothetical protein